MTITQIIGLIVVLVLTALGVLAICKKIQNKKPKMVLAILTTVLGIGTLVVYLLSYFEIVSLAMTQVIGLLVVLESLLLGSSFILLNSKKHSLAKWVGLFIFIAVALTWVFGYGYYNGAEFSDLGMNQQGLTDLTNHVYYALSFASDKIIFIIALGCFYGIINKVKGYKKLVANIAESFKGKEIVFALIASLFITICTSVFSQTFVALIFVPFVISVLLAMKLDKISAFAVTFGAVLIGVLGITYGGEGAYWFNKYTNTTISTGLLYRVLVLAVSYILFSFFTILHMKKVLKENVNEVKEDPFYEETHDKKAKTWPVILVFTFIFIISILGFVRWQDFGVKCFEDFFTWLTNIKIGEFPIFQKIFGTLIITQDDSLAGAFGHWNLFFATIVLAVSAIIMSLLGKVKFDEFLDGAINGIKKIAKPLGLYFGVYLIMVASYFSPSVPSITNAIFKNITSLNPYLLSFDALLASVFNVDFGFSGFSVATFFVAKYAENVTLIHTVFTTMYGFAGIFLPTSGILLIGLSYLDIDYKTWIKYIWKFVVAILIILLVLFTIMFYI